MSTIFAFIISVLKAIPIFEKYFPTETLEQKIESGKKPISDEIKKEETTGRP